MSLTVLSSRGKNALDAKNYEEAITAYTGAIEQAPTSPDLYIQRSIANQRAQKLDAALEDAEQAVINATKRAKRELIIEAQFRRGLALFKLKRHADACFVLELVLSKVKDHKEAVMWNNMAQKALNALDAEDPAKVCTVSEIPVEPTPKAKAPETTTSAASPSTSTTNSGTSSSDTITTSAPQQTPMEKIRHDWYQTTEHVYVTLLAKGVPKDKAQIDITERSLSIDFPLLSGSSYHMTLEPLFAAVNPEKCTSRVLPSKVEIVLAKATAGRKWANLEGSEDLEDSKMADSVDEPNAVTRAVLAEPKFGAPAYPTSSKKGPKDWDKITADDDEASSGDPNDFFKTIFKGASPDMQRAMMKSYTESNGTSLSTNWDEVSKGKVETLPPDGMVAKDWKA